MWLLILRSTFSAPEDLTQAVALGLEHFEKVPAAHEHSLQLLKRRVGQRAHLEPHALGEEREHIGVQAISPGKLPGRLGEGAHLTRVDHDHGKRSCSQRRDGRQLIAARSLEHDEARCHGEESSAACCARDQNSPAAFLVREVWRGRATA